MKFSHFADDLWMQNIETANCNLIRKLVTGATCAYHTRIGTGNIQRTCAFHKTDRTFLISQNSRSVIVHKIKTFNSIKRAACVSLSFSLRA